MSIKDKVRILPILLSLVVTFLWSTSFVIIKLGLDEIPPLTFAGLRYLLAFFFFVPFVFNKKNVRELKGLRFSQWKKLLILGFIFYVLTQGAQFLGLSMLPAVSVSLMLNFTPIVVAVMGFLWIQEKPTFLQWLGSFVFIAGVFVYFLPLDLPYEQGIGLLIMVVGIFANAVSSVLGREINRNKDMSPLIVTFVSMGFGSIILFLVSLCMHGLPEISLRNWFYLIWLSGVNTALAFTLWNWTLQKLTAMESSLINGTMLIQIAILAYVFLNEEISFQKGLGMVIAGLGVIVVQVNRKRVDE